MSDATRSRLVRLVRTRDADPAEAALLVAAEASPQLSVEATMLRIDALADRLRTGGFRAVGDAGVDGPSLAAGVAGLGFRGHDPGARVPEDALLDHVLERRVGLPITLSILTVAIGRRLEVPAYPIALPGHVVVGVGEGAAAVVDPFHGGVPLDEAAVAARVDAVTGGQLTFRRSMLRPAATTDVVRRLLNNLTRDYTLLHAYRDALWTVEVKLLLPAPVPDDHRVRARLLERLGRFDEAAAAYEAYLDLAGDGPDADEVRREAIAARARLN